MIAEGTTPASTSAGASVLTRLGPQLLFLHGHIADVQLARRLACPPPPPPRRPRARWRRLLALFGWLGCGAIRAFPH
jgi:hypothetical protein